jgi:hypothetical protein
MCALEQISHLADSREEGRKSITNFEVRLWEIPTAPRASSYG